MISESDYNDLKPYIPMLEMYRDNDIYIGCDINAFKAIYDRIARENLNTGCSACISIALRRTNDLIAEYKKALK